MSEVKQWVWVALVSVFCCTFIWLARQHPGWTDKRPASVIPAAATSDGSSQRYPGEIRPDGWSRLDKFYNYYGRVSNIFPLPEVTEEVEGPGGVKAVHVVTVEKLGLTLKFVDEFAPPGKKAEYLDFAEDLWLRGTLEINDKVKIMEWRNSKGEVTRRLIDWSEFLDRVRKHPADRS